MARWRKIEGKRPRGRPRITMVKELKEKEPNWSIKRMADEQAEGRCWIP